jgi:HlyD family secretion protein
MEVVFLEKNGVARIQIVETGIQDDQNIHITSGLEDGQTIIIGPYSAVSKTLKSGDAVTAKSAEESKKEGADD